MKQEKSLAEDKKFQKLRIEIDEARKDPEFMKALKRFIRLSTHRS
jgi:cytochrome oxidase Cu insertion factor (SCO1/SenC/PrrC family)